MRLIFALFALVAVAVPALAEDKGGHPSFQAQDMANPYLSVRQSHQDQIDATAREWNEDWYGYAEDRYGFNPMYANQDSGTGIGPAKDADNAKATESETADDSEKSE